MDHKTEFLRDIWYYALPGKFLKPGKTVAKVFLNQSILFGRTISGEVFALENRCPHRSIPLDRGCFDGQEVSCGYHGWRFNPAGQCTAIPSLLDCPQHTLKNFQVQSYPVQETEGNIWIYMPSNPQVKAEPTLEIPQVWGSDKGSCQLITQLPFNCGVDPAVVLLVDPAHIPFVHNSWWWRSQPELTEEVKTFDPSPYGFTMRRHQLLDGNFFYRLLGEAPQVEIFFYLPGIRVERITSPHHTVCNVTAVTPITETTSEVTNLLYTTFPWLPLFRPVFSMLANQFLNQDRAIIRHPEVASQPASKAAEIFIKDADTPVRWYYQLKREFHGSRAEGRSFVNPVKTQTLSWYS
jgi:phenylpropionate dioxygenase-like ring-hydroxylating dioxygenase large terminal subunit